MAYPDYSVVIISVTENGVTNDYAQSFFNDELAKKFYNQAISEGKRAFYYEKPTPTRFVRNDSQPLKVNDEKGLENQPVQSIEAGQEEEGDEFVEDVINSAQATFNNAVGVLENIFKLNVIVAKKYWNTFYVGPFKFLRKVYRETIPEPVGVIGTETVSNKRITWRHDGSGGITYTIEKLWPDKDEISWNPPLNQNPTSVITAIEGVDVNLGTKRFKWVHDGTPTGGPVTEEYTWVVAGGIIHETGTKTYRSDGNGWYTSTDKANSSCDPEGTVVSSVFLQDLMYPIVVDSGLEQYVQIGQQYAREVADGECLTSILVVNTYSPNGTVVYETETTYYKSNGLGGVYEEAKGNGGGGDGGDGGDGGGGEECLQAGYLLGYTYESMPNVTEVFETTSFSYSQGFIKKDLIADGTCGTTTSEEGVIEYNDEGLFLGNHFANGQDYIATAGPNGSVVFSAYSTPADGSDGDEELDNTVTNEDYEFPEPPSEPCPPANYGDGLSTSVLKSNPSGNIVGTISKREIVVVLPEGYYNTATMGLNGAMPSNTKTFTTGRKWSGRFIADGNCGWVPEPAGPRQWTFPEGTSFPAGDYTNLVTVSTSGGSGTWTIWKDDGMLPNNAGRKFTRQNCGFKSDGKGNVTCFFK